MTELLPRRQSVHLLSVGAFGACVGRYLKLSQPEMLETTVCDERDLTPDAWPQTRATIIAAWRPVAHLCEVLDEMCHKWRQPLVPLIMDSTMMRLGPIVVPGRGPCWRCWVRRSAQHAKWPKQDSARFDYYTAHPSAGPQGYLEPFAMMAAARIAETLGALNSSCAVAGNIWQIDVITRNTTASRVVGIHDCPRCGLHRDVQTRSTAEMRDSLAFLWKEASGQKSELPE